MLGTPSTLAQPPRVSEVPPRLELIGGRLTTVLRPRETLDDAEMEFFLRFLSSQRFADQIARTDRGSQLHILKRTDLERMLVPKPAGNLPLLVKDAYLQLASS